ncbi:MAG TPA: exosortase/archaeosortase family protein [Bryobacteraceae bacterium]|nr:exosortase/archaeosortase family protein [Bryobacteraceae bacterium]
MGTTTKALSGETPREAARSLPWAAIAWFGVLLIVCYAPVLRLLVAQWMGDADMGHGFFVPIVAGWVVWQRREQLMALEPRPNYWGLLLVLWGMVQMLLGSIGAELFLARTALLISLTGMVLLLGGTKALRLLAFPLVLLIFMIPIPAMIYSLITLKFQLLASSIASNSLNAIGIPVLQTGNILELPNGMQLSVAEACSGIRSLLSLSFLSLVYGYLFDSKPWMRIVLLIGALPIAIAANAFRVTLTGLIADNKPEYAEGAFHTFEGWVLFLVALLLLVGFHRLVNAIYYRWKNKHGEEAVA